MSTLFSSVQLGDLKLSSRFIKTAAFEGMTRGGVPSSRLIEHHRRLAEGGTGLTTVSYGAVSSEGRTFDDQLEINPSTAEALKKLTDAVHGEGGRASIQLTHCGYFTKNTRVRPPLAPSRLLNLYGLLSGLPFSREMTGAELEKTADDFASAAELCKNTGFDALEIHMGHGYLLSQFLSPWSNRRKDSFGGDLKGRSKFPLMVFDRVRARVGKEIPLIVKLNLDDGFSGGFTLDDCITLCGDLEMRGCNAVILSGGFTSRSPFYLLRGDIPLKGMIANGKNFFEKLTMALFGPLIIKKYEYESAFFLTKALAVRKAVNMPLVYLGGVDSLGTAEKIFESGFDFLAVGRALIHDPDFIRNMKEGSVETSGCNHCNQCIAEMDRDGVRCVLLPKIKTHFKT